MVAEKKISPAETHQKRIAMIAAVAIVGIAIVWATAYLFFAQRSGEQAQNRPAESQIRLKTEASPNSSAQAVLSPMKVAIKSAPPPKTASPSTPQPFKPGKSQRKMPTGTTQTIITPQNSRDVVAEVMMALDDPDPEVRLDALERLADVNDELVNEALQKALNDTEASVREEALNVMIFSDYPEILLPSLAAAIDRGDPEMASEALDLLSEVQTHQAIDLIIEKGLGNSNSEIREEALSTLEGITDQVFDSDEEARSWWDQNKDTIVLEPAMNQLHGIQIERKITKSWGRP